MSEVRRRSTRAPPEEESHSHSHSQLPLSASSLFGDKRGKGRNFKVVVRVRPTKEPSCIAVDSDASIVVERNDDTGYGPGERAKGTRHAYSFDRVFAPQAGQKVIYDTAVHPVVMSVLQGYNGSIIAYGQTGSGKTHTIEGASVDGEESGVIPRAVADIFDTIRQSNDTAAAAAAAATTPNTPAAASTTSRWLVRVSFLQIYNERISDLLAATPSDQNLKIREGGDGGVFVEGLEEHVASSAEVVLKLLRHGKQNRTTHGTKMNRASSRSHAVFTIIVEHSEEEAGVSEGGHRDNVVTIGKLHLVDLAGSERFEAEADERHHRETQNINTSLSAFGNVVQALTSRNKAHVPYRDSKLTRILQDSVGGNCKTTLITTVNPAALCFAESLATLNFARRAKSVKNMAVKNEDKSERAMLSAYEAEIRKLRAQLDKTKSGEMLRSTPTGSDATALAMAHALERTQEERERAEREKDLLAMKISQLEAKMLTNAERIEDTAEFQEALERERTRLSREHASQAAKMEAERERLKEEKAAFERERLQWQQQTQRQKTEQDELAPPQQSPVSPGKQPLPPGPRPGSSQRQRSSRLSRRASDATASQPARSPQPPHSPRSAEEVASSSPLLKENLQALQRELNAEEVYDTVQQLEGSDSSDSDATLHAAALHDAPPAYDMPYAYASSAAGPPPLEGDGDGDFWAPVHAVREARLSHPERDDAGSADNALSLADLYAVMAAPVAHTAIVERYRRALAETGVGLPRTSRRIRLSLYENVVSGADAAGWFMAHLEGVDTMTQAQTAGQILLDLGILATARGVGSVRGGRDGTAGDQFQIHKNQLYRLRATASAPLGDATLRATSAQPRRRASASGNSSSSSSRNGLRPQSGVSMRSARSSVSSVATFATAFSASSDGDTDDFFEQDEAATTASQLHVAAAKGDLVYLRALASELPIDLPDALGRTPLMYAIIANRGRACKFLLKRGAAVNVADAHGHTALLWAACRGNRDALKVLLTKGADLGLADTSGRTAIHWACKIRRTACLEQLLRKSYRAAANHPDVEGQRPLHWAVLCGHHEHVALLLRQQADACQGDLEGRTPLHYAVNTCQLMCLRVLLSANPAAVNAADSMGRTPLHLASGEELDEPEDAVAAAGGTAFDLLMATPALDINQVDVRGTTALHWAAVCNRLEICTRLLQAGARRDARDAAGNTPADYAREKGYVSCFNLLEGQELVSAARQAAGSRQARPPASPVGTSARSSSASSSQTSSSAGIPRERTDVIPAPVDNTGAAMRMPSARPFSRAMPALQRPKLQMPSRSEMLTGNASLQRPQMNVPSGGAAQPAFRRPMFARPSAAPERLQQRTSGEAGSSS